MCHSRATILHIGSITKGLEQWMTSRKKTAHAMAENSAVQIYSSLQILAGNQKSLK